MSIKSLSVVLMVLVAGGVSAEDSFNAPLQPLVLNVDVQSDGQPISPLIYGGNRDGDIFQGGHPAWTVYRLGGNAVDTYNWEINANNAGRDYHHQSGMWVARFVPPGQKSVPGAAYFDFIETAQAAGSEVILQLPMAGYVAADSEDRPVTEAETAPSDRWIKVEAKNPQGPTAEPDLTDGVMYLDDAVHAIVQRFGTAEQGGVAYYSLSNEPDLWHHTHPRVCPQNPSPQELGARILDAARAIKDVDPSAKIITPTPALVIGQYHMGRPDAFAELAEQGYPNWLAWLLDEARKAEQAEGRRLIDVLSVNWYVDGEVKEKAGMFGVLQSPRTLWDETWTDPSWRSECFPSVFPVIPKLRGIVEQYYPGTELAITEFNPEAYDTIHGSIALVDMLGVFGREGLDIATYWSLLPVETPDDTVARPAIAAYELYRDADGQGLAFGDISLPVSGNDRHEQVSVYAARDSRTGDVHVIVLSKRSHRPLPVVIKLDGMQAGSVKSFGYGRDQGYQLSSRGDVKVGPEGVELFVQPLSARHLVISSK